YARCVEYAGDTLAAEVFPLSERLVPEGDPGGPHEADATADPRTVEQLRSEETSRTAEEGAALADRITSTLLTWTLLGAGVLAVVVIALSGPLAQLLLAAESPGAAGVPLGATL